MTQQATRPISKAFSHALDLQDVRNRAQAAFEMYRDQDKAKKLGINPTFAWRPDGTTGDVTFTVMGQIISGTIKVKGSSLPGAAKDGTIELTVNAPMMLVQTGTAQALVSTVGKEVEKWLT